MASTHIIDLNHNDELGTVIQKVNRNFKLVTAQVSKQSKINQRINNDAIDSSLATIVSDLTGNIEDEAEARRDVVSELQNQIDTLVNTTLQSSIRSGILFAHPVGSLYFTTGSGDPSNFVGGTWSIVENSFQIGSTTAKVWIRTA